MGDATRGPGFGHKNPEVPRQNVGGRLRDADGAFVVEEMVIRPMLGDL
jgi:hypothetical protein